MGAPSVSGSSQVYAASVIGSVSSGYWRLGEPAGQEGVDLARAGSVLTYNGVTLGTPGTFGPDEDTAAAFDGTSSYATIYPSPFKYQQEASVELWFNTTHPTGMLLSHQYGIAPDPLAHDDNGTDYPLLWIGTDGKLYSDAWPYNTSPAPVTPSRLMTCCPPISSPAMRQESIPSA